MQAEGGFHLMPAVRREKGALHSAVCKIGDYFSKRKIVI